MSIGRRALKRRAVYGLIAVATVLLGAYLVTVQGFWPYVRIVANRAYLSSACDPGVNYDSWSSISVLVITSGSTGKICVEYSSELNYKTSFRPNIAFYKYKSTSNYSETYAVPSPIQVTASPDSVSFGPNTYPDREIVTFTITVPSNMTRSVYGTAIAGRCLWFSPIAVIQSGDSPTEAAQAALSYWSPPLPHCPVMVVGVQLLGVSGFDVESG